MYDKLNIKKLIDFSKNLKVLYIEDNKDTRISFVGLMDNFFDDIVTAIDGMDGLEKFKNDSYDLIITDIRMPKLNGIEMIKKIKEIENNIPIIVTTAHQETELLIDCIKCGVDGYLLKPIEYKQFQQTIQQTCEKIYYFKKHQGYELSLEKLVKERTKELEITQDKLIEIANKDHLTNLYNRRYFHEISQTLIKIAHREKSFLSLLMLDIDKFKRVNDIYGHIIGDNVLTKLAQILKQLTRESDILVRFGGEEFIIILPNTSIDGAVSIANKIREEVEDQEITIDENNILKFTISIGVAQCDCKVDLIIEKLVSKADEALYEAKQSGRNKVVIYK